MKITIEPTQTDLSPFATQPKVTIEVCRDHLTMPEMIEDLIIPALLGMGFQQETIDDHIGAQ
jgi:hypothetical protein